jgi:nucleoside-diphosphate-sugar epimerase
VTRVLVTGAGGFVGRTLCGVLARGGYVVRAAVRADTPPVADAAEQLPVGDITTADWTQALRDVQYVIHTAARAHTFDAASRGQLYLQTNAEATRRLAQAAAGAGVRKLVYLSSVKVNGEGGARPYGADDEPQPGDVYARSKMLGEKHLREVTSGSAMEAAIVRAPLVYGAGVRANFLRLLDWVERGWPLPFAAVDNRRSLVSVWNLCDLLQHLLTRGASGRVWMVSDAHDLSTPDLLRRIAQAMQRRAWLFAVPPALLRAAGAITGRGAEVARLCDSLTVDVAPTCRLLGWSPPVPVDEGLRRTVAWYRSVRRAHVA